MKLPNKDFVWTPELAYIIGLLVTDGNLSSDGRHIIMRSSDYQLLETFKKCLKISNKICVTKTTPTSWTKKPAYRIQYGNIQFYKWLLDIGLFPAKTYSIADIQIPDEYFRDFLRGHLDGDGSITTYLDYYNTFKNPDYIYTRLWVRFISVSKPHIEWLRKKITQLFSVKGHLSQGKIYRPDQTIGMQTLKFGKKDSIKLLSLLYYDPAVPCLERKRKIARKFLIQ